MAILYSKSVVLLTIFACLLPGSQGTGTQASRSREGCFNSTTDLGMARGTIPDSDITASSTLNASSHPHFARLGNSKAWIADRKDHPWIQVNLQKVINITAIATQGFYFKPKGMPGYIRQYYLSYSDSGNEWMNYTTQGITKVFQGNVNHRKVVTVVLNPLVVAQYIRLHPTNCSTYCALRMELYGCNSTTGVPGRPPLPTVNSVSTTSISIQWSAPDEVGNGIAGYNVRWQENGTSTPKQKVITGRRVATLDSLTPYTWYDIQVQAYNKKGNGPWSLVLKVRSNESVPSAAPANFKLSSSAPLTLDLSWDTIPVSQRQGILLGFIINYTKDGSGVSQFKNVGPDQFMYKIEGLEFAKYFFKVAGFTAVGNGKFTVRLSRFPNEGVPSAAPGNFKLGSSASLSLDVSWDAIPVKQQQGILLGYRIEYRKNGSGVSQTKDVGPNQFMYKIQELEFARYFVQVAGYTAVGNGKFTDSLSRFPNEGAPTPPRNLQLSERSSTSISVSWEEPETKNGNLKRYVVSYGTQSDILNKLMYTTSTEYLLEPLEEYTRYFVQVHAETNVSGDPSEIKEAMTLEDAPSSDPGIIKDDTKAEDAHSIRVVWQEISPKDQNGIITGYTVYYNVSYQEAEFSKNTSAPETSTLLSGLKPYTTYCIKVAGYTKVGRSPLNDTAYCLQTLQAVPSKPRDVRAQLVDGSINVFWKEPADPNGILTRYEVYCNGTRSYNSSFQINLQIVTPETSRFALIKKADIKPGTKFTIHLKAFTSKGKGEQSDPAVVNTPSAAPPPPPTPRVVEDEVTPFTITISLTPSSDVNGKVIAHQVVVEKLGKVSKRSAASVPDLIFGYEEAKRNGEKFYIAARFDREDINNHRDFVVGNGKKYGDYENKPLEPETKYKVYVRGVTSADGKWIYGDATPTKVIQTATAQSKHAQQPDKDDSKVYIVAASLGTVLFLALTALSVAVAFLLKYKKRREKDTRDNISMNAVRGEAEELILNPADRGRQQRLSNEESEYADLDTHTTEYADLDTHTMATPNGVTYASLLKSEGGNNLEESPATDLFPRSGKEEEPLSPVYVNQIPTPTYENI